MISLRKYLFLGEEAKAGATCDGGLGTAVALGLLEHIDRYVLTGENQQEARRQTDALRNLLRRDLGEEQAAAVLEAAGRVLATAQAASQQAATSAAVAIQGIVAMLNRALMVLAGGSDRSVSRLNKIEEALRLASMLEDIVALKTSLAETVKFVEVESAREREAAAKDLEGLQEGVQESQKLVEEVCTDLPGRQEAVRQIPELMSSLRAGESLYAVAYLLEQTPAVVQRYGLAVASELGLAVIRERLRPLAPGYRAYQWTAASLVGLLSRKSGLAGLREEVALLQRQPLVHRTSLGGRRALIAVTPSYMVAEGDAGSPQLLIAEVDRFAGAQG